MQFMASTARRRAIRRFWEWLTGTGYRPERHYMRGGHGRGGAAGAVAGS